MSLVTVKTSGGDNASRDYELSAPMVPEQVDTTEQLPQSSILSASMKIKQPCVIKVDFICKSIPPP